MVTINDAMPFHVLISSDDVASLMSLQVFLTLHIPISSLTPTPLVRGPSGNVMETHRSIILPVSLGAIEDFQTFLVNFYIVGLMLPYEDIITSMECQAALVPSPPCQLQLLH
jgi:hypothetical protein